MGTVERTSGAPRPRLALVAAIVAVIAMATAGCGSGSETATAPTTAAPVTASSAPSTTAAPTSSTATPGAASGAAALGSDDDDDDDRGGSTARSTDEPTDADEVAPDVTWSLGATEYRGEEGLLVVYDCPPDGVAGTVWGSDVYTDDSSVCTAAVHAGLITETDGGEVVIEIGAGLDAYDGSTANGVTSLPYGPWDGSFTFADT